jgi:hypothetical protein
VIAALLVALLATPATEPWFWVERDGDGLRVTADLTPLFDAKEVRRLTSGLTTTLHLTLDIRDHDEGTVRGATWREARARWDLWDEVLYVELEDPTGTEARRYPSVDAFLNEFARFQTEPLAGSVERDPTIYDVRAVLEVNPLSVDDQARMRRWLAEPGAGPRLDPVSRTLFGSFVRLFDNLRPGAAERVLRAAGHPFRADRLQYYKPDAEAAHAPP